MKLHKFTTYSVAMWYIKQEMQTAENQNNTMRAYCCNLEKLS